MQSSDKRKIENNGIRSLFDTEVNIKIRILTIVALAGAVGNTLGFLANLVLYGFNSVTAFCAFCAMLIILYLLIGIKSRYSISLGYAMLFLLDVFEFPLLTLTYGAVMYPYLIIGFHALVMITENKKRIVLCSALAVYDVAIIIYSSIHPYLFGPQDSIGLLGSAVVTFIISLLTVASLVIIWQNVYLLDTLETDPVTKVLNQVGFIKNVRKILSTDTNNEYVLLYFNACSFKAINTIYGVDGGNNFLRVVANTLSDSTLEPRLVARLNADHFVCLVNKDNYDLKNLSSVFLIPFSENGREILVNLYCGVYEITDRTIPVPAMIDRASTTLRFIHKEGNNHYAVFNSAVEDMYHKDTVVLAEIDKAISEEQFVPYYQPIIDCQTGKIASAEVLARWIHPELGIIPPSVFIPVLEGHNLISNLDRFIANRASSLIQNRLSENKAIVPISINLSRDDLFDDELINDLHKIVREHSDDTHLYRIEITESVYEDLSEHTINKLAELRKDGVIILVDDFGNGYSSLGMITDYQFDIIKLDMQFARKMDSDEKIRHIIQGIIELAHKLDSKVVAEGIETESQYSFLKEYGCDYVQGYYFFKPLSEKEFIEVLDSQNQLPLLS